MTKMTESDFQRLCEDFVRKEVVCCVSSLVATLAQGVGAGAAAKSPDSELWSLCEQAMELAAPVLDYEEAAVQEGWAYREHEGVGEWHCEERAGAFIYDSAQQVCEGENIDPYGREIFEHWVVTQWLADKLESRGEKVDKDFAGLCVWARTCTGQSIAIDDVIRQLTRERHGLDKAAVRA